MRFLLAALAAIPSFACSATTDAAVLPSVLAAVIQVLQVPTEAPKDVDVCALFSDPLRWNGKFVKVSGQLELGNFEGGPWLSGRKCPAKIKIGDVTFPNVIELTDPSTKLKVHEVGFHWDDNNWNRFNSALSRVDHNAEQVAVTVIGVFETRDPLSDLVRRGRTFGFGLSGGSPAQILVKTMPEIKIAKK